MYVVQSVPHHLQCSCWIVARRLDLHRTSENGDYLYLGAAGVSHPKSILTRWGCPRLRMHRRDFQPFPVARFPKRASKRASKRVNQSVRIASWLISSLTHGINVCSRC